MMYRIVLSAEDGEYVLDDGFTNYEQAIERAEILSRQYGEGQQVYITDYSNISLY